nr:hypothetical protein OH820_22325 [Streptomyces sp. NBC_00857]
MTDQPATGSAADLIPHDRPLTRDDPVYLRLLELVLTGLGGTIPLAPDDEPGGPDNAVRPAHHGVYRVDSR